MLQLRTPHFQTMQTTSLPSACGTMGAKGSPLEAPSRLWMLNRLSKLKSIFAKSDSVPNTLFNTVMKNATFDSNILKF